MATEELSSHWLQVSPKGRHFEYLFWDMCTQQPT